MTTNGLRTTQTLYRKSGSAAARAAMPVANLHARAPSRTAVLVNISDRAFQAVQRLLVCPVCNVGMRAHLPGHAHSASRFAGLQGPTPERAQVGSSDRLYVVLKCVLSDKKSQIVKATSLCRVHNA